MNTFADGFAVGMFVGLLLTLGALFTLIFLHGWYVRRNRFMRNEGNPNG